MVIPWMDLIVSSENVTTSPSGSSAENWKLDVTSTRVCKVLPSSSTLPSLVKVMLGGLFSGHKKTML